MSQYQHQFQRGFSLAEILVVISIISAMAFFLVKNYASHTRNELVDKAAGQLLEIKRAALAYYVDIGIWPDVANNCIDAGTVLVPSTGPLGPNPWGQVLTMSCPQLSVNRPVTDAAGVESNQVFTSRPSLQIRQALPTAQLAQQLANRLPGTTAIAELNGFFAVTYIPMVLMPGVQDVSNQVASSNGGLSFFRMSCPIGQVARAILVPKEVCRPDEYGVHGYRITTAERAGNQVDVLYQVLNSNGDWRNGFRACSDITRRLAPTDVISVFQYCEGG